VWIIERGESSGERENKRQDFGLEACVVGLGKGNGEHVRSVGGVVVLGKVLEGLADSERQYSFLVVACHVAHVLLFCGWYCI